MKDKEMVDKAVQLYKYTNYTMQEISNITNMSKATLSILYRDKFEEGVLEPRNKALRLIKKPKKFTEEQENEIAYKYFECGYTYKKLHEEYGIFPTQLQRIRKYFPEKDKKKVVKEEDKAIGAKLVESIEIDKLFKPNIKK